MASWSSLFGSELATASNREQSTFPTDDHLAGKEYCMLIGARDQCANCPGFFARLQSLKDELEEKGVGLVCLFNASTLDSHFNSTEKYPEVHIPVGFPTLPDLLEKKRRLLSLLGESAPSYVVFDSSHQVVVGRTHDNLAPMQTWLRTHDETNPSDEEQADEEQADEEQADEEQADEE